MRQCKTTIMLVLVFVFAIGLEANATPGDTLWTRTYGGSETEFGNSVIQLVDMDYLVLGYTNSYGAGDKDFYLLKIDTFGDTVWTRTYGGSTFDVGECVVQNSDDDLILTGYTGSYGAGGSDFYLIKTNPSGDTIWTHTYGTLGDEQAKCVQQTGDGGYIIAGFIRPYGGGYNRDFYLVKTDASGDTLWTRSYGGSESETATSVRQTSDGGYIMAGYVGNTYPVVDIYVVKTNSTGDTLWTRLYGGSGDDEATSIQQTSDGGYVIGGLTDSYGAGSYDYYLVRINSTGDTLWTRTYGKITADWSQSMQITADNGYVMAGLGAPDTTNADFYLIRIDSSGDTLWTRYYGDPEEGEEARSVYQTSDGGYILAGLRMAEGSSDWQIYVVKTVPESQEVPTLPEWGLIILSVLLLVAAVWLMRRRRMVAHTA